MKKTLIISALCLSLLTACTTNNESNELPNDDNLTPPTNNEQPSAGTGSDAEGNSNKMVYKDGTYHAEQKTAHGGYKDYVSITIKDGQLTNVEFEGKNESGMLKTQDKTYAEGLKGNGVSIFPEQYMPGYAQGLMENMDVTQLKPIEGAEDAHKVFTQLVDAALENAKTGKTDTAIVDIVS